MGTVDRKGETFARDTRLPNYWPRMREMATLMSTRLDN